MVYVLECFQGCEEEIIGKLKKIPGVHVLPKYFPCFILISTKDFATVVNKIRAIPFLTKLHLQPLALAEVLAIFRKVG